jgi:XTP/dITP diphosphohydrolase
MMSSLTRPVPGEALLLATTNPAKADRLRWVFAGLGFHPWPLPDNAAAGPDETGESFAENAALKAVYWSRHFGGLAAASDGGMAIPALGAAWDALRTARGAGPGADDVQRARHLLALCRPLEGAARRVWWSEALALARDGELLTTWSADGAEAVLLDGFEASSLRPGFWAASLCFVPALGVTLAALDDAQVAEFDTGWSRLRDEVRTYFGSGQGDL